MAELPDWMYAQSAVVPYRWHGDDLRILLISNSSGRGWTLPKGSIEPDMTPSASAEKEAWEEAGIRGEVGECSLGSYSHRNWAGRFEVEVFPMCVATELDEWPERSVRRREWVSIEESLRRLRNQDVCEIVRRLPNAVS